MPYMIGSVPYQGETPYANALAFDADVQAWFTAVEATGANFGSTGAAITTNKTAWSNFVIGCKADGIWAAIQQLIFLRGVSTLAGTLVPFKGPAPTNILFVQGSLNPATGMIGNGVNRYLNLNRSCNADLQNSMHSLAWVSELPTVFASGHIGAGGAGVTQRHFGQQGASQFFSRSTSTVADLPGGVSVGLTGQNRNNAANYEFARGGSNVDVIVTASAPLGTALNYAAFARLNSGPSVDLYSNARLAAISTGPSINLAAYRTRLTTLFNTLVWP